MSRLAAALLVLSKLLLIVSSASADESAPTPYAEITRVLALLPKPEVAFIDYGCGAEARWCITAAQTWGCPVVGLEIDPSRAAAAQARVTALGLDNLVIIINADATTSDIKADVGVVYLYEDTIKQLLPKLQKLKAFASYIHEPKGVAAVKNGQTWIYKQPLPEKKSSVAVWNGVQYNHPVCNNPNCGMCASIRAQLAGNAPKGHYEVQKVKVCNGRSCWFVDQNVWVPDPQ